MITFIANLVTIAIAATLILLAIESQTVLQYFGYVFGGLLFVALLLNWNRADKSKRTP